MIFFHRWLNKYAIHWQFMTIHELWNLINFSEFLNVIRDSAPPISTLVRHYDTLRTKIDIWLTPYTNYFSCRKTISSASNFKRCLFTLYHIISLSISVFPHFVLLLCWENKQKTKKRRFSYFFAKIDNLRKML